MSINQTAYESWWWYRIDLNLESIVECSAQNVMTKPKKGNNR